MPTSVDYTAPGVREGKADAIQLAILNIQRVKTGAMCIEAQIVQGRLAYHDSSDDVAPAIRCHDLRCVREGAPQEELVVRLDVHSIDRRLPQ